MKKIVFATIGAASVAAAAQATVTIIPVADNRVVHVQGTIIPAGSESTFESDALAPGPFEPFDGSVDLLLELPDVSCSGGSTQTSQVLDNQLVGSGFSTVELAANAPKTLSSGNSCSHFVVTFEIIEPASYTLTGVLDAVDAPAGTADAWVWVKLERLFPEGVLVVDQTADSGALNIDTQGVLAPGLYRIAVESHVIGMVVAEPSATASASFDVILTVQEQCPDLDGDNTVGIGDFLIVLGSWGEPGGDTNGDGTTDILDFLAVLGSWGPCP